MDPSVVGTSAPAGGGGGRQSGTARARWELENQVQAVGDTDSLFKYDPAEHQVVLQQKPWSKDPHFFKQ